MKDHGARRAVTAGKHLDGFVQLLAELLTEAGVPHPAIHRRATTLPGYFRPTKNWDLVVVSDGHLLASVELKAQVGSFGNNVNNRIEEALGNATDLMTAYREGKFKPARRPWLGWLMLLEDSPKSNAEIRVAEPHFEVFGAFKGTSYAKRYEMFCERLVRERMYDGACLLMSSANGGRNGIFREPNPELCFRSFVASLIAHATAHLKTSE